MSEGKIIYDGIGPKSQPIDAVKSMIEFFDHKPCARLPKVVMLANNTRLIRSSKGDCYYVTTPKACSCLGFHYKHSCKHVPTLREEEATKAQLVDSYAFDTKPGEIRYWQEKQEQKLSPSQELARNIVEAMES